MATGFEDSYKFKDDVVMTGEQAATLIVSGVLKNKEIVYVPRINFFFSGLKLVTPKYLLRLILKHKVKINPKFLILNEKNKFD